MRETNRSRYFKILRQFREKAKNVQLEYQAGVCANEPYQGSPFGVENAEALLKGYHVKMAELREQYAKEVDQVIAQMIHDAGQNMVQKPTPDMVNTLSLVKLDKDLTYEEVVLYVDQMRDCPVALKVLRQIAAEHNISVGLPSTLRQVERINSIRIAAKDYIGRYDPKNADIAFPSVKLVDRALESDSYYREHEPRSGNENDPYARRITCADDAERQFLEDFTGSADVDGLEPNASSSTPVVHYKFNDLRDMMAEMDKVTAGVEGVEKTIAVDAFLANCPEQYGAKYREYRATGNHELIFDKLNAAAK